MESMTEAYGRDVPDTIGRYDYDQERSGNNEGPIEDGHYYDDGEGHAIAIEAVDWKDGFEVSKQRYGPAVTDCIMSSKPVGEYDTRQQAFEAAEEKFNGPLQKIVRTLLGGM